MKKNILIYLILPVLIGNVACVGANSNLDKWASNKVNEGEKLLCKLEHNKDYFLAIKSEDRLKIAYRIDVTSSTSKPQSFILRWQFQNEKDEHIGLNIFPEVISNNYVSQGDKVYAEELSYFHVYLNESQRLKINIGLKRYESSEAVPSAGELNDNDLENINFCDALNPGMI